MMLQEETIRRLERERKSINEKTHALETSLAQAEADRRQLKDKVVKLQNNDSKIEQEKEAMRSQIENAESRITRIDLKKRAVEGDLERVRLSLQDNEAEKHVLRERIGDLVNAQQHLEQKATSLQLTVSSHLETF